MSDASQREPPVLADSSTWSLAERRYWLALACLLDIQTIANSWTVSTSVTEALLSIQNRLTQWRQDDRDLARDPDETQPY